MNITIDKLRGQIFVLKDNLNNVAHSLGLMIKMIQLL